MSRPRPRPRRRQRRANRGPVAPSSGALARERKTQTSTVVELATEVSWQDSHFVLPMERILLAERVGYDAVLWDEVLDAVPDQYIDENWLVGNPTAGSARTNCARRTARTAESSPRCRPARPVSGMRPRARRFPRLYASTSKHQRRR